MTDNAKPVAWTTPEELRNAERGFGAYLWATPKMHPEGEVPLYAVQPPQDERGQPVALTDDIQAIKRTALDCMPGDEKQALVRIVRQCIDLQKAVASAPALPPSGVEAGYGNNKVTLTGPAPTLQAGQGEPLALSTLTDDLDWWLDLAQRHANADWNSEQPDGFLNAVKALCRDFAMSQGRQP